MTKQPQHSGIVDAKIKMTFVDKLKKIRRKLFKSGIYLIVFIAILACSLRLFTPLVTKYKPNLEKYLSVAFNSNITVQDLRASWLGLQPVIELNNITAYSKGKQKKLITIDRISIGINLWQSLINWQLQPGLLLVDGANLQVSKTKNQSYQIRGYNNKADKLSISNKYKTSTLNSILSWFINHNKVRLKNIKVDYHRNISEL